MQGKYGLPIRKLVCRVRHEQGLKQQMLANQLGVDVRSIQYFESGEKIPSAEHLLDYLHRASIGAADQFLHEVRTLPAPVPLLPQSTPSMAEAPAPALAQP
jgi:transcriptional regulator with XRE-family HTH domain